MLLLVTEVGVAAAMVLIINRSLAAVVSKFEPLIVTDPPVATIVGEKDEIVGLPEELVTVNEFALVAVPAGAVTETVPVVAPEGTVTTNWVVDAELMMALVPWK